MAAPGQALESTLGTTLTLLDTAKAFLAGTSDPYTALFQALLDQVESLINDTFGAGVYQLYVNPFEIQAPSSSEIAGSLTSVLNTNVTADTIKGASRAKNSWFQCDEFGIPTLTPAQVINHMVRSFEDEGDLKRPTFSSGSQVTAFGILITAPSISGMKDLLEPLMQVFEMRPFTRLLEKLQSKTPLDDFPTPFSRRPDWNNTLSLSSIPILREQRDVLINALNLARGYVANADDSLGDLIRTIERKVQDLLSVVQQFNDLINKIKNATAASGAYIFDFPPQSGGVEAIKEALNATPELRRLTANKYSAGVLFVGGGPSMIPVNTIRELLT